MGHTQAQVWQKLLEMNEDELFYKDYWKAARAGGAEAFLSGIGNEELKRRQLVVPELPGSAKLELIDEEYFSAASQSSVFISKHNRFTPPFPHTHVFFEIICVMSGTTEQQIMGQTMELQAGDCCLVSPAVRHTLSVMDEDSIVLNILMRRSTIEEIFGGILRDPGAVADFLRGSLYMKEHEDYLLFHAAKDEELSGIVLEMYAEQLQSDSFSDRMISSMLMIFLTKLVRRYGGSAERPRKRKETAEANKLMRYMAEHVADGSLKGLAKFLGYSMPYASKAVKTWTGCNYKELATRLRLERAKRLLRSTSLSVSQIGAMVGYENPENFMRMFRKTLGVTPSAYRTGK